MKQLLENFIEWAKEQGDAWYIYENTEEAIEAFLKHDSDGEHIEN